MKDLIKDDDYADGQSSHRKGSRNKEYAMMAQIAHMYYELDMLQPEIAEKMYCSRSKVSRMITQARKVGIVQIRVKRIIDRVVSLEKRIREEFGLKEVMVISSFDEWNSPQAFQSLTDSAALHLSEMLEGRLRIGVTNGRTLSAIISKLHRIHPCTPTVVQLMGNSSNTYLDRESIQHVAALLSAFAASEEHSEGLSRGEFNPESRGFYLNAPLYMENSEARKALLSDPLIQEVFEQMSRCDIILTSVGEFMVAPPPGSALKGQIARRGYQSEEIIRELNEKGAIGSICGRYYDINGQPIPSTWNENCISMPFEEIQKNPMTICIASGEVKVEPLLGALRGGLLNGLITDAHTASNVLERQRLLNGQSPEQYQVV